MTAQQHKLSLFIYLPMLVVMAWRNVWRNWVRSLLTISAMAAGLALMIVTGALIEGMNRQMVTFATDLTTGHIQLQRQAFIDDQDLYAQLPASLLTTLENAQLDGVHYAPRLYAAGLASSGDYSTGAMLKAVEPEREAKVSTILQHVKAGKSLPEAKAIIDENGFIRYPVLVGNQMAKNLHIEIGDELVLITQAIDGSIGNGLFHVSGIMKPLEPGFDRMGVLMSMKAYQSLMYIEDNYHEIVATMDNIDDIPVVQEKIKNLTQQWQKTEPQDELSGPIVVRNWREVNPALSDMLAGYDVTTYIFGIILFSLAALGVMNTMLMAVHERTHEFGILIALGMRRISLLLMVMLESLFLAISSALVGMAIGILYSLHLEEYGIDFSDKLPDGYDLGGMAFEPVMKAWLIPETVYTGVILMVSIAMLAALFPSWRTVRLKPAEVL